MFSPNANKIGVQEGMQIAFVSSCLPRKCGIATFSAHLSARDWGFARQYEPVPV